MSNRSGFTLVEVLIALFIISTAIFALSELQVRSVLRVWDAREEIDRLYYIKKYLYRGTLDEKQTTRRVRDFEDPAMRLVVEAEDISKRSSLAPYAKDLRLLKSSGIWERGTKERSLDMVAIIPRTDERGG